MKSLLILRHGKSDWDAPYGSDHERPLAQRGRKAAITIGRFLGALEQPPEVILTSSAERARSTAELVVETAGLEVVLRVREDFYGADPQTLVQALHELESGTQTAMVVGHEPTLSETVGRLVGDARVRFPTAALARIEFMADTWSEVQFGTGELQWLIVPRALAAFAKSR